MIETSNPIVLRVISDDPDNYKLALNGASPRSMLTLFNILSEAVRLRTETLVEEYGVVLSGVATKVDVFDLPEDNLYFEFDTLHVSDVSITFEAYCYSDGNRLHGKASCTFFCR